MVVCKLGLLYNKEAVLKGLLEKNLPGGFEHIARMKDVKEVKFVKSGGHIICPVSTRELDDGVRR